MVLIPQVSSNNHRRLHHVEGQIQRVKFCSEMDLAEERGEGDSFNLGLLHTGFLGNSFTRETKTWTRRVNHRHHHASRGPWTVCERL